MLEGRRFSPEELRQARESRSGPLEKYIGLLVAGDEEGREFLLAMYTALRSLKFYPVENEQVQSSLNELTSYTIALFECEEELEVRIAVELLRSGGFRFGRTISEQFVRVEIVDGVVAFHTCRIGIVSAPYQVTFVSRQHQQDRGKIDE